MAEEIKNEIEHKNAQKQMVPAVYYDMFALRILGVSYQNIARKTGYSYDWVRHLFCADGPLNDLYRNWVENKKKENISEAYNIIIGNLPAIILSRVKHSLSFEPGAVESSKMLISLVLGDPSATQNNIQINNVKVDDEDKELILNAFKNFGLIKETNVKSESHLNKRAGGKNNNKSIAKKGKR